MVSVVRTPRGAICPPLVGDWSGTSIWDTDIWMSDKSTMPNTANPKEADSPTSPAVRGSHRPTGEAPSDSESRNGEQANDAWSDWRIWDGAFSWRGWTSVLISCGFHLTMILVLSMLVAFVPRENRGSLVVTGEFTDEAAARELDASPVIVTEPAASESSSADMPLEGTSNLRMPLEDLLRGYGPSRRQASHRTEMTPADALRQGSMRARGGGFEARRGALKARMLADRGGTPETERAVQQGLAWLAAHQWQDGGWRFDLSEGPCGGRCDNSGTVATSTGATGLALLPFLGAGHTHQSGKYRDVVRNGLQYLQRRIVQTPHGADLQEGTMYAQGIATTALCEAYAMTQDVTWGESAQQAIDFIQAAQHSEGGWRYYPGQPGDTTVFGWQMMALKSAALGGLDVPAPVVTRGQHFLDTVQLAPGAYYGYVQPDKDPGPTAIGLLIRMYTGWHRNDPRLIEGVDYLNSLGPSRHDVYFNYYATQVLHHYGGAAWHEWNESMRDPLLETQATKGHERGSWFFRDEHGSKGGRLYTTAMCVMILEVYYRHMPLYEDRAVTEDWW